MLSSFTHGAAGVRMIRVVLGSLTGCQTDFHSCDGRHTLAESPGSCSIAKQPDGGVFRRVENIDRIDNS